MSDELAPLRAWFAAEERRAVNMWGKCLGPGFAEQEANRDRRHLTYSVAAFIGVELRRLGAPDIPPDAFLPAARAAVTELLGAET